MRIRTASATAALTLSCLLGLVSCESSDTTDNSGPANSDKGSMSKTAALPDMAGKGLQAAQDAAQEAGFYNLTSHDALGRGRMQALDRNWKVCTQTPAAGDVSTETKVDFGAVKLEETCPSKDQNVQDAGGTMPDFKGKGVKAARQALPSNTSLTVNDASGQDRIIIMESNWLVCTQEPAAGTTLDGQPITLNAVKTGESC